jgi:ribosomal protein S27AE
MTALRADPSWMQDARELRDRGLSFDLVSASIGVPAPTIKRWLRGYGRAFYQKQCQHCGREFIAEHVNRRYCNRTCGAASAREDHAPIDVAPLRDAFLKSDLTASEVARRLGWSRGRSYTGAPMPDGSRVRRALGLCLYDPGKGYPKKYRERMTHDMAERLMRAMHLDPHEVGI